MFKTTALLRIKECARAGFRITYDALLDALGKDQILDEDYDRINDDISETFSAMGKKKLNELYSTYSKKGLMDYPITTLQPEANRIMKAIGMAMVRKEALEKEYCTQNDKDCKTCPLSMFGSDCHNYPIDPEDIQGMIREYE